MRETGSGHAGCWLPRHHLRPAGFGASSRPSVGDNYDTLAADLAVLLDGLDLREVVLRR